MERTLMHLVATPFTEAATAPIQGGTGWCHHLAVSLVARALGMLLGYPLSGCDLQSLRVASMHKTCIELDSCGHPGALPGGSPSRPSNTRLRPSAVCPPEKSALFFIAYKGAADVMRHPARRMSCFHMPRP